MIFQTCQNARLEYHPPPLTPRLPPASPHRSRPMSRRLLSSSFWLSFFRSANT